jgi:CHAT domain-containing protein
MGQPKLAEEIFVRRSMNIARSDPLLRQQEHVDFLVYTNQSKRSVAAQEKARQFVSQYTSTRLPKLTEAQRMEFIQQKYLPSLNKALSLGVNQRANARAVALSAGWLINGKAVTEEALAEASLLSSEEAYPTVQKLNEVRQQLAALTVNANIDDQATKKQLAKLESEQIRLQRELTKFELGDSVAENWVPVGNIINALSDESCFITIAKFRPFNVSKTYTHFKDGGRSPSSFSFSGAWLSEKYVAWVVPPLGLGNVQCIDLGDASKIDNAISRVRKQLIQTAADMGNANETKLEAELKSELGALSKLILKPLDQYIEDVSELIISPDGELWTIPWELLHDGTKDGEYLIESKRIRYVSSGRELVRKLQPRSAVGAPVIFADPNYDLAAGKQQDETAPQFPLRGLKSTRFLPLASSAAEAEAIAPSIKEFAKEEPKLLTSFSAQESAFKKLHRPKVLAISTHGYFEQDKRISNPLLRCGLALSGANNRRQAIESGKEDGILTGLEIVGTDLRGTELVVLSACETGLGEVTSGEGVAGLRQAFQLAGAQSVVSSLWQVEDGETARLMKLFFQNLAEGKSKSEALRQAQLSRIKARRARHGAAHPFFWAAFTLTGQD